MLGKYSSRLERLDVAVAGKIRNIRNIERKDRIDPVDAHQGHETGIIVLDAADSVIADQLFPDRVDCRNVWKQRQQAFDAADLLDQLILRKPEAVVGQFENFRLLTSLRLLPY